MITMANKRTTPLEHSNIKGHHCTVDVRLEKLGMVPFFQSLSDEELREVHKKFSSAHYAGGETIYFRDDKATLLRVVVHGSVKLVHQTLEGKDILLDMLKPGEFFGSLSALGHEAYTETAEAQTAACVLSIGLRDFRAVLNAYPSVAMAVLDITAGRLASSQEKIRQLTTLPAEKRIAGILRALAEKFGEESEYGRLIQLPLSRKELADMAGTSAETASRIMSRFQQNGIVKTGRQWVAIADGRRLAEAAEE